MVRFQVSLFAAVLVWPSCAHAQDKAKAEGDDPIAMQLRKAKEEYQSTTDKAVEKMLVDFAAERKKVEDSKTIKVEQRLKLLEQLQEEKAAFEADRSKLPSAPGMKLALGEFQKSIERARKKCEMAFDTAAVGYDKIKDFVSVKQVIEEKKTFFFSQQPPTRTYVGQYKDRFNREVKLSADGKAVRIVTKDDVTTGRWKVSNDQCIVTWESGYSDVLRFDKNGKDLAGKEIAPKGKEKEMTYKVIEAKK